MLIYHRKGNLSFLAPGIKTLWIQHPIRLIRLTFWLISLPIKSIESLTDPISQSSQSHSFSHLSLGRKYNSEQHTHNFFFKKKNHTLLLHLIFRKSFCLSFIFNISLNAHFRIRYINSIPTFHIHFKIHFPFQFLCSLIIFMDSESGTPTRDSQLVGTFFIFFFF